MAQYRLLEATVDAQQWRRLGDILGDKPLVNGVPRIVKAYNREDVPGTSICTECKNLMSSHGWIDKPPAKGEPSLAGVAVHPGTGKPLEAPPAGEKSFPKLYRNGVDTKSVANEDQEKRAIADGWDLVIPPTICNTLAWQRGDILFRIEGAISLERALEIADSLP